MHKAILFISKLHYVLQVYRKDNHMQQMMYTDKIILIIKIYAKLTQNLGIYSSRLKIWRTDGFKAPQIDSREEGRIS
jgi:hypothetical protein